MGIEAAILAAAGITTAGALYTNNRMRKDRAGSFDQRMRNAQKWGIHPLAAIGSAGSSFGSAGLQNAIAPLAKGFSSSAAARQRADQRAEDIGRQQRQTDEQHRHEILMTRMQHEPDFFKKNGDTGNKQESTSIYDRVQAGEDPSNERAREDTLRLLETVRDPEGPGSIRDRWVSDEYNPFGGRWCTVEEDTQVTGPVLTVTDHGTVPGIPLGLDTVGAALVIPVIHPEGALTVDVGASTWPDRGINHEKTYV